MHVGRILGLALCLVGQLATSFAAQTGAHEGGLAPGLVNPGYHDKPAWFKESFLDIREDIGEAEAANKRVMLYFYQDGCPYCAKLLNDNFGNPAITEKTRKHFDVIAINMWGDREVVGIDGKATTEKAFANSLRVQYTPTLLFLGEQGDVVLRINGYFPPQNFDVALDYVAGRHENSGPFRDYLAQSRSAPQDQKITPIAEALPHPLRLRERPTPQRRLLVLFEEAQCAACDDLHQILSRDMIAYALTNLDVAQVDIDANDVVQTPDGHELKAGDWARELGIQYAPSLVFFDAAGNELFRTEALLRSFHVHGAIDYVVSGAYLWQPSFQRFLQHRTETLRARGKDIDLMQ